MKILITGSAGFIGFSLSLSLLKRGNIIIGVDNHNDYYDTKLKEDRVTILSTYENYVHERIDISKSELIRFCFEKYQPDHVINLAAQAGVRYSLENPFKYIESNLVGFANILECCRHTKVKHLIYASSSSVYGANTKMPFSIRHNVDHPLSLYAATKKSNELMAHSYSHLYNLPTTGLRFFTVYGPWGRPDMALFKFTKSILNNESIQVFNNGNHKRDFTFIDDIVEGLIRILERPAFSNKNWNSEFPDAGTSFAPWRIYNIGNNIPIDINDFINAIEKVLGKKAIIEYLPMQPGDVPNTCAEIDDLVEQFNFRPIVTVEEGLEKFIKWYIEYFKIIL